MTEVRIKPGLSADEQLDRLVDARHSSFAKEDDRRIEASWAESARTVNLRAQAERRREWVDYHRGLARLHTTLAAEHEAKAFSLMDGKPRLEGG